MSDWDELDDVELAAPAVPHRREHAPSEELWAVRYPHTQTHTPPPGLSRRQRRRWLRDVHRDERRERDATAAGWRRNRPQEATVGLSVIVLIAVVAFAAFVWWRAGDDPTPAKDASSVAASEPRSNPGRSSAGTSTPSADASTTAPADGHDHGETPLPPPGLFDDKVGERAYWATLGYLTYSPAYPEPVDTWVAGWGELATPELVDAAPANAERLWGFTVREAVHVTDPRVLWGTRDGNTWWLRASWVLFPIGGDESSPTVTEEVDVVVSVVGDRVSDVTVTGRTPREGNGS